jgi:hypothetical protein
LVIKKRNLVDEHNLNFFVDYDFPAVHLFREPLMIIISLLTFCIFIMVYVRFDFSISKVKKY